jgi:glycosyltransferase involved in cell wall biosynthesis
MKYNSCAFTRKGIFLAKMLTSLGHELIYYGAKDPDGWLPDCTEFIETHTIDDIRRDYSDGTTDNELGYDWQGEDGYRNDFNDAIKKPSTLKYYANSLKEIQIRKRPDDFIFASMGNYQKQIVDSSGLYLKCEPGIGYRGSCKGNFRCFESAYIQNFTYGSETPFASRNGNFYDRVIPNYLDPDEFTFSAEPGNYYLYIGRMIQRKGVLIAYKTCEAIGAKLILVGQGAHVDAGGNLVAKEFTLPPGNWEYHGFADIEMRKKLLSHAIAVFVPTEYMEPFSTTHVETMISGTPIITSNFGVFGDGNTFVDGVHGFKCATLDDFVNAALKVKSLDRGKIWENGNRFNMWKIRWDYQRWLDDLHQLYLSTTDKKIKAWHHIRTEIPEWRNQLYG